MANSGRKKVESLSEAEINTIRKFMEEFDFTDSIQTISLKAARVNAGYSRKEVAQIMGVSVNTVTRWESQEEGPDAKTFLALCRLYRVDPQRVRVSGAMRWAAW